MMMKTHKFFAIVVSIFIFFSVVCEWTDIATKINEEIKSFLTTDGKRINILHSKNSLPSVRGDYNINSSAQQYNDFVEDHIPNTNLTFSMEETIDICIIIGGASAALEAKFLLRSLYIHARRSNLFFHLIVTKDAKKVLVKYFTQFTSPAVNISYEFIKFDPEFVKRRAKSVNVPITHHSGVFVMAKSFMYDILSHLERCLILDTDLVFGTDPAFLWTQFRELDNSYFGALKLGKNEKKMCSGVMLQRFSKMRESNFDLFYKTAVPKHCKPIVDKSNKEYFCRFGDQSLIFAVQQQSPLFMNLGDSWSLELCHDFRGHSFQSWEQNDHLFFGIVHFNCLQGRNVDTIDEYMRKYSDSKLGQYLVFLDSMND